jgi:glycosyltransferase involved in cell wall biosynthesis
MQIALAYPDPVETTSLGRETVLIAETLRGHGADVHLYQRPGPARPGVVQHTVGQALAPTSRLRGAVALGRWAGAASGAIRRDRPQYDIVCVVGSAGWEHDLVRVHAVIRAEQHRWPERGGRDARAARARAALAPVLRPHIAVERSIQRLQFRPGRFTQALAVTDEVAEDLVQVLHVDSARIEVIPCLIDYEKFAAVPDRARIDEGSPQTLLFIGNDFARKGLASAIRALPELRSDLRLVVVGGDDPAPFRRLAVELGVADRVEFAGATTTPERFYAHATALLAPTTEDVWGMALVEAMTAGVPVIASSAAGAGPLVEQAGAGILIDVADIAGLVRAIERIVDDPVAAAAMGDAGRRTAAAFQQSATNALARAFEPRERGR